MMFFDRVCFLIVTVLGLYLLIAGWIYGVLCFFGAI